MNIRYLPLCTFLALLSTGILSAEAQAPKKNTADFYKSFFNDYDGKLVTLMVASLRREEYGNLEREMEGMSIFQAQTWNRGNGGYILVAIPKDQVAKYVRKYGIRHEWNNPRTKKLNGILTKFQYGQIGVMVAAEEPAGTEGTRTDASGGVMKDVKSVEIEVDRTEPLGQVVVMETLGFKVESFKFSKTIGKRNKNADGIFLAVRISVKNRSDQLLKITDSMFIVVDKNNTAYPQSSVAIGTLQAGKESVLSMRSLSPGQEITGVAVFDVPNRTDTYALIVDDGNGKIKTPLVADDKGK